MFRFPDDQTMVLKGLSVNSMQEEVAVLIRGICPLVSHVSLHHDQYPQSRNFSKMAYLGVSSCGYTKEAKQRLESEFRKRNKAENDNERLVSKDFALYILSEKQCTDSVPFSVLIEDVSDEDVSSLIDRFSRFGALCEQGYMPVKIFEKPGSQTRSATINFVFFVDAEAAIHACESESVLLGTRPEFQVRAHASPIRHTLFILRLKRIIQADKSHRVPLTAAKNLANTIGGHTADRWREALEQCSPLIRLDGALVLLTSDSKSPTASQSSARAHPAPAFNDSSEFPALPGNYHPQLCSHMPATDSTRTVLRPPPAALPTPPHPLHGVGCHAKCGGDCGGKGGLAEFAVDGRSGFLCETLWDNSSAAPTAPPSGLDGRAPASLGDAAGDRWSAARLRKGLEPWELLCHGATVAGAGPDGVTAQPPALVARGVTEAEVVQRMLQVECSGAGRDL
jgi:hypothetical protein